MAKRSERVVVDTLELFDISMFTVHSEDKANAELFTASAATADEPLSPIAIDAQYLADLDRSYQMMVAYFKLGGVGITEIAVTLSLDPNLKLEQYRYLMGGIITQRSMWSDKGLARK